MPGSLQKPAETTRPSVILIEEYDALCAALTAALRKFAPEHAIFVAKSLREAESLAGKNPVDLFVIDADPPWPGISNFLKKMRAAHPNARGLVIGAAIPPEIAAERGLAGALQFAEKPFELPNFGAAVQALLGPWREAGSAGIRGSLAALNPIDIVLLHYAAGASVILDLHAGKTPYGEIQIYRGQVSHAEAGKLVGADALREILTSPELRMRERVGGAIGQRTVAGWTKIVIDALRALPVSAPAASKAAALAKRIVAVDDTEMLLVFVQDVLTTADAALQVTTAKTATEGLERIRSVAPDLVLLDYDLPDFNGGELCRRLLQDERTASIPVIMMSAHAAEMTAAAAQLGNIRATIEKPFFSKALVEVVRRTLTQPPRRKVEKAGPVKVAVAGIAPRPETQPLSKTTPLEVPAIDQKQAVLGLFLDVIAMQFTPQLQMGSIRARPASTGIALQLARLQLRDSTPAEIGFQLAATELDATGRISLVRLRPSGKPFQGTQTRNVFQIGSVAVIPADARQRVQLTPTGSAPMTVKLVAQLELAGIQLSQTFQVEQLALKWPSNIVRVTLNPKAPDATGARFAITAVTLSEGNRLKELVLDPVK
ncbi:MAG TPA: response regulator [Chthoniobacterales bacterium]|nr:response regulator [Chthoniobacterales bacterium]